MRRVQQVNSPAKSPTTNTDTEDFIKLNALRLRIAAKRRKKK
ncbi:MAG TPA: hypothetical protein VJ733_13065 [Candidatus Binatia bacterium]|nr:hypothetical protein [Candidatus Binatia bacterium]